MTNHEELELDKMYQLNMIEHHQPEVPEQLFNNLGHIVYELWQKENQSE